MIWLPVVAGLILAAPTSKPDIGLSLGVPESGGAAAFLTSLRQQIRLGLNGSLLSAKWQDLEPTPGNYNLKPIEDAKNGEALGGWDSLITIQTLDTNVNALPADLRAKPFDDPETLRRFKALVTKTLAAAPEHTRWLSLGNEADAYLIAHPDQVDGYVRLLAAGREAAKQARPKLEVGVTTMASTLAQNRDLLSKLQAGADVVVFTYYPMADDFSGAPISQVGDDLDRMLGFAGDCPVVLQEVGYPSATELGGEAQQAEFVRRFYSALAPHQTRFQLVNWFLQVDLPKSMVDSLRSYYGLQDDHFAAFLGSLGLRRSDGTPKPAWAAFKEAVAPYLNSD